MSFSDFYDQHIAPPVQPVDPYSLHPHTAERLHYIMHKRCQPSSSVHVEGATVCPEWTEFPSFFEWAKDATSSGYAHTHQLSLTILDPTNTLYAPHTVRFIPKYISSLFAKCDKSRKKSTYPLGVRLHRITRGRPSYIAECSNLGKQRRLGSFTDALRAHHAWQHAKVQSILDCIDLYQIEDVWLEEVVDALMLRVNTLREAIASEEETCLLS